MSEIRSIISVLVRILSIPITVAGFTFSLLNLIVYFAVFGIVLFFVARLFSQLRFRSCSMEHMPTGSFSGCSVIRWIKSAGA